MPKSALATALPLPKPDTPDHARAKLEDLLAGVESALDAARMQARPVTTDLGFGRLSRQDALQEQALAIERVRRLERHREQLRAALQRIDDGTYGTCVSCEEPIEEKRLGARPEAAFCIRCQR